MLFQGSMKSCLLFGALIGRGKHFDGLPHPQWAFAGYLGHRPSVVTFFHRCQVLSALLITGLE